jgi:hypothetical protein
MYLRSDEISLPHSVVNDIANSHDVDFETVMNIMQSYVLKREQEKSSELKDAVKEIIEVLGYENSPTPQQAYEYFVQNDYSMDLGEVSYEEFKKVFLSLTTDPAQLKLFENKKKNMQENDFGWEGPQPGDAEYHNPKPQVNRGIGNFNAIDWQVFYEELVANTQYAEMKPEQRKQVRNSPNSVNDWVDAHEGMFTHEEFQHLEDHDIVHKHDYYYIFGSEAEDSNMHPLDYNSFINKVKSIWGKDARVDNSPSQFRYRDDGGTDGG